MDFERCAGCPGGECPAFVQKRLQLLAVGKRSIAANWSGLGAHYLRQGNRDLATAYENIAAFDSLRADALEKEAQKIENHCGACSD